METHFIDLRKKATLQYSQLFYTKIALLCEEWAVENGAGRRRAYTRRTFLGFRYPLQVQGLLSISEANTSRGPVLRAPPAPVRARTREREAAPPLPAIGRRQTPWWPSPVGKFQHQPDFE